MTEDLIRHSYLEKRKRLMLTLKSMADDLDEYRKRDKVNHQAVALREQTLARMSDYIDDADSAVFALLELTEQRYAEGVKIAQHRAKVEEERIWETSLSREGQRELIRKQAMAKWPELYDRHPDSYNDDTKPQLQNTYWELTQVMRNQL